MLWNCKIDPKPENLAYMQSHNTVIHTFHNHPMESATDIKGYVRPRHLNIPVYRESEK